MHVTSNPLDWYAARAAGIAAYVVDPTDPVPAGFTIGDIWA